MKLKKGDEIIVSIGKDKGQRGKIERVDIKANTVLVTGVNMYKRHLKKRDEKNPGGIIDLPKALATSKVTLICPKCKKSTRVGWSVAQKEKHRICKKCGQMI